MSKTFYSASALFVKDIDASLKFYQDFMRLEIKDDFGPCKIFSCGIAIWKMPDNHLINQKWKREKQNGNFEVCFETEEFDVIYEKIKQHNVPLLHDVHEETWGQKTIRVFDPDNNLVEIGETIPTFVKRMYEEGMSVEEIAVKSSVPKEEVKEMIKL
jgi:catechol 2,3-dioxygenase-like lactoylglutathione lyase family enzyme